MTLSVSAGPSTAALSVPSIEDLHLEVKLMPTLTGALHQHAQALHQYAPALHQHAHSLLGQTQSAFHHLQVHGRMGVLTMASSQLLQARNQLLRQPTTKVK